MFGDIKIDKLRLTHSKTDVDTIQHKKIVERLKAKFRNACTFSKINDNYYSITPTKLIRDNNVTHNLQMPSEKELLRALKYCTLNPFVREGINVTEIHLTKDIILSHNPDEYINFIAGMKLPSLTPVMYSSNSEGKSVYLAPPKRDIDDEEYTGNFVIKFYNKTLEYLSHNEDPVAKLNEPLTCKEQKLVGEAYNKKENSLDISKVNILRVEIVYKTSKVLMPVIKTLSDNTKELSFFSIIRELEKNSLYLTLEKVFNSTLKKYVFFQVKSAMEMTEGYDRIKSLAVDLLAISEEFYHYKAIFNDMGMKNQFSELQTIVRKIKPESDLYIELYDKFFNMPLVMTSEQWKRIFKTPCKGYSSKKLKGSILVYEVPIWDDS